MILPFNGWGLYLINEGYNYYSNPKQDIHIFTDDNCVRFLLLAIINSVIDKSGFWIVLYGILKNDDMMEINACHHSYWHQLV